MSERPSSSFRDPDGFCGEINNRILRWVKPESSERIEKFLDSPFYEGLVESGRVQGSKILRGDERKAAEELLPGRETGRGLIIEHEPVFFPSYAFEWCEEAFFAAGRLTLEIQSLALEAGLTLKDATPNNILHRGTSPLFVDIASFQPFRPENPIWVAHGQFVRTFLLPLLVGRRTGVPGTEPLLQRGDGMEPEEVYRRFTGWQRLGPISFFWVTLPTWLGRWSGSKTAGLAPKQGRVDAERSKYMAKSILGRLEGAFNKLRPKGATESKWSRYMASHSYTPEAFAAKATFVRESLEGQRPRTVLDVGCNSGHFSRLAVEAGARVVGLDWDAAALDKAWRESRGTGDGFLPLRVDFSRPTPGAGWRNQEQKSFLERARNRFEGVILLAAMHHLVLGNGIPTTAVFQLLHELGARMIVIERVGPGDPMALSISRNREHLLPTLEAEHFEQALGAWFTVERKRDLPGMDRSLYLLLRKNRTA